MTAKPTKNRRFSQYVAHWNDFPNFYCLLIPAGCTLPVLNNKTNGKQLKTFKGQSAKNRLPPFSLSFIIQVPACNI